MTFRYLANPCSEAVREEMKTGERLGVIDTPKQQNVIDDLHAAGVPWCADNGCFSARWEADHWWAFLERKAERVTSCIFATAPDVVGDAAATLPLSLAWLPRIRSLGYPAALVAQDGLENHAVPWDEFDVLFLGGSTEWKLGPAALGLAHRAVELGKRVHMGRVNSRKRMILARDTFLASSADGTFLTFAPDTNLARLLRWFE